MNPDPAQPAAAGPHPPAQRPAEHTPPAPGAAAPGSAASAVPARGAGAAGSGGFPATRHSVIERIRSTEPALRRAAFGDLVAGYWKPLYTHLRLTWRLDADDAADVTQGFLAAAYEKGWLERYEPGLARFRTYVRMCADRHVMNWRQSASRQKRGGGAEALPLDFAAAERELPAPPPGDDDPDVRFHREFVRALFARAVEALRAECAAAGRADHFALFERYDLSPAEGASYESLARAMGLTVSLVTNRLAATRRRFRTLALESLRGLCGSDDEYREEARALFGVDVG